MTCDRDPEAPRCDARASDANSPRPADPRQDLARRRAEALRDNLKRRKAQARARRAGASVEAPDGDEPPQDPAKG
jgi:hypothetical protein